MPFLWNVEHRDWIAGFLFEPILGEAGVCMIGHKSFYTTDGWFSFYTHCLGYNEFISTFDPSLLDFNEIASLFAQTSFYIQIDGNLRESATAMLVFFFYMFSFYKISNCNVIRQQLSLVGDIAIVQVMYFFLCIKLKVENMFIKNVFFSSCLMFFFSTFVVWIFLQIHTIMFIAD